VLFNVGPVSNLRYYEHAISEGAGFNWSINPPPHGPETEPRVNIYGPAHIIFRSTPEQQLAAWVFLKWLTEPEQQAQWVRGTDYYPVRQSTADLLNEHFTENPIYAKGFDFMMLDQGQQVAVTGYEQCEGAIEEMLTRVLREDEEIQVELDNAVEECNQTLEEIAPLYTSTP
jgi:multiple sugar transport system substrate-binding protein/sn-glycerol 3-phosphate transport system substrate-binding protein